MIANPNNQRIIADIEGLRAVAVVAVLLYHAHLGVPGGFVGVDVFFVISGYLITLLLVRELRSTGRVSMVEFYARRARRLLPAASVVLVATLLAALFMGDPIRRAQTASDGLWAAGFVANFHFAMDGADYFASNGRPSLLQHWWSLAVEEQFYMVWPLMLSLAWRLSRRRSQAAAISLATVILAVSMPLGAVMTWSSPSWAYFATWTRGWELSAGALVALAWTGTASIALRTLLRWGGLMAIAVAAFGFSSATAFPGWAALLPVGGSVAVLMSAHASSPSRVLGTRIMQWLGARSYGLYLWHWPLLVLLESRISNPSVIARVTMIVLAVALAAVMFQMIENPIRFAPVLVRSGRLSLVVGMVLSSLVVGTALAVRLTAVSGSTGFTADTLPRDNASPTSTNVLESPQDELRRRVESELRPFIESAMTMRLLPDNLEPRLEDAPNDKVDIHWNDCMAGFSRIANPPCVYGNTASETVVALFGDSHAAQWFPALESISVRNGYALHALTKMGCPAVEVSVRRDVRRDYPECDTWRRDTLRRIAESDIDIVVLSSYRYRRAGVPKGSITESEWTAGMRATLSMLRGAGKKVIVLSDTPVTGVNTPECLAENPRRIDRCSRQRSSTVNQTRMRNEQEAAAESGASYWDTTEWMCTDVCPPVIGNLVVYLDDNHLSNTYAKSLSPYLELVIKSEL